MKKLITGLLCSLTISPAFAEITFDDARVRAVPPTQTITAAFMQIHNTGSEDLAIIGAESPVSEVVELHTHIRDGEKMQMRQIPQIELPAMATTTLQPGGLHLMLIGLKATLELDQPIDITLKLSNGETQTLTAPVKEIMPMMQGHGHQMEGKGMQGEGMSGNGHMMGHK